MAFPWIQVVTRRRSESSDQFKEAVPGLVHSTTNVRYWNSAAGRTPLDGIVPLATAPSDPDLIAIAYAAPGSLAPGGAAQYFIASSTPGNDENFLSSDGETILLNAVGILTVPEPGSLVLLEMGGLLLLRRNRG